MPISHVESSGIGSLQPISTVKESRLKRLFGRRKKNMQKLASNLAAKKGSEAQVPALKLQKKPFYLPSGKALKHICKNVADNSSNFACRLLKSRQLQQLPGRKSNSRQPETLYKPNLLYQHLLAERQQEIRDQATKQYLSPKSIIKPSPATPGSSAPHQDGAITFHDLYPVKKSPKSVEISDAWRAKLRVNNRVQPYTEASSQNSDSANDVFRLSDVPCTMQRKDEKGCWYECARMLAFNKASGPRLGIPDLLTPGNVREMMEERLDEFMANEGLAKIPLDDIGYNADNLIHLLHQHGPILFGWKVPGGGGHMSVLTGVDKNQKCIIFHDPMRGPNFSMPLDDFGDRVNILLYSES